MRAEPNEIDIFPTADDFLDEMDRTLYADRRKRIFYGLLICLLAACLFGLMVHEFWHISLNLVEATDGASGLPKGSLVITQQERGEDVGRVLRYTKGGSLKFQKGSGLTQEQTKTLFQRGQMEPASGFAHAVGFGLPVLLFGILVVIVRELIVSRRYCMPDEAYE